MDGSNSNVIEDDKNKGKSPLRQPTEATQARLLNSLNINVNVVELNQNNSATSIEDETKPRPSFALNANATEFVPRCSVTTQSTGDKTTLSVEAQPFVPRQNCNQPVYPDLVDEFEKTLFILTANPGNMEEYMRPMCDLFKGVNASEYMQQIIELLYEQSISEPNFRYTGARVCRHICNVLKDHTIFSQFRSEFLNRCKQDFDKRDHLLSNQETVDRACGLTLFMGELFQNLEVTSPEGKSVKIGFLPKALRDLLLTLLSYPSDSSVKCSCQLLKLCGASMEQMLDSEEFDEVFTYLQNLTSSSVLTENIKFLIQTVTKLRESNWGQRGTSTSSQEGNSNHHQYLSPDLDLSEPIFYSATGQPISRKQAGFAFDEPEEPYEEDQYVLNEEEEEAFLQWQQETMNGCAGEPDYSHWSNPTEKNFADTNNYTYVDNGMDDEMDADFEEFLRQQNQHQ